MVLSPSSAPTSPQLLRYVSSQLVAALHSSAPTISLPSALRGVDAAAATPRLQAASRAAAPSPKGRPGAPRQGSGGHVHSAAPAMATIARAVVPLRRRPTPPGPPAQGSGGKIHAALAAATTPRVVMRPAPPGRPAEGSGGKVHALSPAAMAPVLVRGPARPGPPAEGAGGRGGNIHAVAS